MFDGGFFRRSSSPRVPVISKEDHPGKVDSPSRRSEGNVALQILGEVATGSAAAGSTAGVGDAVSGGDEERQPLILRAEGSSPAGLLNGFGVASSSAQQSSQQQRGSSLFSGKPSDRGDREKRLRRRSGQDNGGLTDTFQWIWGGSKYSGILCMAASSLSYSLMGLLVKLLAVHNIPSFETVFVRCAVIATAAAIGLRRLNHPLFGAPSVRLFLLARAVIGFVAISAFFYSIQVLPLRDATTLNFTMPFFTAIIASLVLHEKWGLLEAGCTSLSFAGVILVTQPIFLFGEPPESLATPTAAAAAAPDTPAAHNWVGVAIALLAAALGGGAYVLVRSIGKSGEPPLVVVFALAAFSTPASAICMLLLQSFVIPSPLELLGMVLVGITAFLAQLLLSRGLQLEKAARATSMQYIKVLGTYTLGVLFLGEMPTLLGALGAFLIGASSVLVAVGQTST